MKHYQIPRETFYTIKKQLDGMVFYRNSEDNKDMVEVKTNSKYAKNLLDKVISQ